MLPEEYKFFCKLKKIEDCSYVGSSDCQRTCNLSRDYQFEGDIESEIDEVLGELETKNLNNQKYLNNRR